MMKSIRDMRQRIKLPNFFAHKPKQNEIAVVDNNSYLDELLEDSVEGQVRLKPLSPVSEDLFFILDCAVFNTHLRSVRAEEAFTPSRSPCAKASRQGSRPSSARTDPSEFKNCAIEFIDIEMPRYDQMKLTQFPFMIQLSKTKNPLDEVLSSNAGTGHFNIRYLSGMYAYCLISHQQYNEHTGGFEEQQALLLKMLDKYYESNHSILELFLRRNKFGVHLSKAVIICGGEIVFNQGVLESWNLKSGGYSLKNEFNENQVITSDEHLRFILKLEALWLPTAQFRFIKSQPENYYQDSFEPNGALKNNELTPQVNQENGFFNLKYKKSDDSIGSTLTTIKEGDMRETNSGLSLSSLVTSPSSNSIAAYG